MNATDQRWNRRKRPHKSNAVGRMFNTSPTAGELFYLRILLTKRFGHDSFDSLKIVNNVQCISFKETCNQLGYLQNDNEWIECLQEASTHMMPRKLRDLFVTILLFNEIVNPLLLWNNFKDLLSEDYRLEIQPLRNVNNNDHCQALYYINDSLFKQSTFTKSLWEMQLNDHTRTTHFFFEPPTEPRRFLNPINHDIQDELNYDIVEQTTKYNTNYLLANVKQRQILNFLFNNQQQQKLCFIDAPGGTGKTFLFNTIMAKYRSEHKICLGSSSSGISSILLDGGKTVHSRFKIPLKVIDNMELKIRSQGNLGQLLIMCDCILIDEAPMLHRYIIESIDKLLKRLMTNNIPFGGKTLDTDFP